MRRAQLVSKALIVGMIAAILIGVFALFVLLPPAAPQHATAAHFSPPELPTADGEPKATAPGNNTSAPVADLSEHGDIRVCPVDQAIGRTAIDTSEAFEEAADLHVALVLALSDSSNGDQQLLAEVLSPNPDPDTHIAALGRVSSNYPQSRLAALHLLSACASQSAHAACGDGLVDRVLTLDGDNGIAWIAIANFELQRGNRESGIAALQNAAGAPVYEDYFRHHLSLLSDFLPLLAADGAVSMYGRALSFAVSANFSGKSISSIVEPCATQSTSDRGFANVCLALGQQVQDRASSLLDRFRGTVLQEATFLALGDSDSASEVLAQSRQTQNILSDADAQAAARLLNYDANLAASWFAELLANGELEAQFYLQEEAESLSANPDYDPCP